MTKRDMQASEYAAESYEETCTYRCVPHMPGVLTDAEREAIKEGADALYGDGYDAEAATLRKLLERPT